MCLTKLSRITLEALVNRKSLSYEQVAFQKLLHTSFVETSISHSHSGRIPRQSTVQGKVVPVLNYRTFLMLTLPGGEQSARSQAVY